MINPKKCVVHVVCILIFSSLLFSGSLFKSPITPCKNCTAVISNRFFDLMSNTDAFLKEMRQFDDMQCNQIPLTNTRLSKLLLTKIKNDTVIVTIQTYTNENIPKTVGGDVILVWAEQVEGKGRSAGKVVDNLDGSYTGHVQLFTFSRAIIKAKLASSSRNTCLRYNALKRFGNVAYSLQQPWGILGLFVNRWLREETRCGTADFLYGYTQLCNFTSLNDNNPWYCGKPRHRSLRCDHIYSFNTGRLIVRGIRRNGTITQPGHSTFKEEIAINSEKLTNINPLKSCKNVAPRKTWTQSPSGYWDKHWIPSRCKGLSDYSHSKYRICLKTKTLAFLGDSTIRQYFEYLCKHVLDLGHIDAKFQYGPNRTFHPTNVYHNHNISMLYRKHEMPFHNPDVRTNGIRSIPTLLRELANSSIPDDSLLIVVNYYSHLQTYPPSAYRQRLSRLVAAIKTLLTVKPRAKILFKGPHVCIKDSRWFDTKFALLFRDILFEEFHDVMDHVIYLDVWGLTVAHDSELLHPTGLCLQNHIQQLMSFICE